MNERWQIGVQVMEGDRVTFTNWAHFRDTAELAGKVAMDWAETGSAASRERFRWCPVVRQVGAT
jgi:hypothetical protein